MVFRQIFWGQVWAMFVSLFPHTELEVTVSMLIWLALKDPERKLTNLLVHPLFGQIGLQAEPRPRVLAVPWPGPWASMHFTPVLLGFWAPGDTAAGELQACYLSGDEKDAMRPPLSTHIMVPDCPLGN